MNSNFIQVGDEFHCLTCHRTIKGDSCVIKSHTFQPNPKPCNESCGKWFKTPQPDEWEKEFEDWWTDVYFRLETFEPHKPMLPPGETANEVKSFIRSTIQSAVEREREEVIKEVEGLREKYEPAYGKENQVYVEALSDVLAHLKSNLK